MVAGGAGSSRDGLEGEGLERVAGEDGGGFAERDVAGGLAAAEVVVVERGEVVVDERVGVEHFDGGAEAGGAVGYVAGDHACGFHGEDGAQAFAAGEGGVAHRAVDAVRLRGGRGEQALECGVGERGAGGEEGFDVRIHAGGVWFTVWFDVRFYVMGASAGVRSRWARKAVKRIARRVMARPMFWSAERCQVMSIVEGPAGRARAMRPSSR